jgi:hypothetical protein
MSPRGPSARHSPRSSRVSRKTGPQSTTTTIQHSGPCTSWVSYASPLRSHNDGPTESDLIDEQRRPVHARRPRGWPADFVIPPGLEMRIHLGAWSLKAPVPSPRDPTNLPNLSCTVLQVWAGRFAPGCRADHVSLFERCRCGGTARGLYELCEPFFNTSANSAGHSHNRGGECGRRRSAPPVGECSFAPAAS